METSTNSKHCPIHKIEADYFCTRQQCTRETTRYICQRCLQEGPHRQHAHIEVTNLRTTAQQKITAFAERQSASTAKDLEIVERYTNEIAKRFSNVQSNMISIFTEIEKRLLQTLANTRETVLNTQKDLAVLVQASTQHSFFDNEQSTHQEDLTRLLNDTRGVREYHKLVEQYYTQFITNVEVIASQWSFGLREYFENFEKSLTQQLSKTQKSADEVLMAFNYEKLQGEKQFSLKGHLEQVLSMFVMNNLYGDDTDLLVSASSDHSIRIWDLQKRRCIKVLESTEDQGGEGEDYDEEDRMIAVYCMCKLSEKKFAAAGSGGTIHLFDFFERAGALKGHTGDVNALQKIDAASQLLISASEDKTLRVWDIDNLKVLHVLKGHEDTIDTNMLSFFQSSSEIGTIVSASRDNTVRVWSYSGTQQQQSEKVCEVTATNTIDLLMLDLIAPQCLLHYDSTRIITGHDSCLAIIDTAISVPGTALIHLQLLNVEETGTISYLAQLDSNCYATCHENDTIILWHVRELDSHFNVQSLRTLRGAHDEGTAIRCLIRYKTDHLISSGNDDKIVLWQ